MLKVETYTFISTKELQVAGKAIFYSTITFTMHLKKEYSKIKENLLDKQE